MTANGSAKRARRRKRCSHRNRRSADHQTRIPPPADQSARKPSVLAIAPMAPVRRDDVETPIIPEPQATREIARPQFARIRTLVKYGMTVAQVAEVYGVAVSEIERILGKA